MSTDQGDEARALAKLATHLAERRPRILEAWRAAVRRDPDLTSSQALSRAEVNDHIPAVLLAFERDLAPGLHVSGDVEAEAHGLHRWQQGYDLPEVARELGLLNECVCAELEAYAHGHPEVPPQAVSRARLCWAHAFTVAMGESTERYFRLQQLEAAGHIEELEAALDDLLELERQRAHLWQQAAHDLRGNLAVVSNATAGLTSDGLAASTRDTFVNLLARNVHALNLLLNDVTSLARLQAGEEQRVLAPFDAAALLRELAQRLTGVAEQRGLYLRLSGPSSLDVVGDVVKTQRIAQNLIMNALAYTREGGLELSWGDAGDENGARWMLTLHDTGPGLRAHRGAGLAGALEQATSQAPADELGDGESDSPVATHTPESARDGSAEPSTVRPLPSGEGLGLSIVKRLCDLLDASVEVESARGHGTTFRILFPRRYEDEPPAAR